MPQAAEPGNDEQVRHSKSSNRPCCPSVTVFAVPHAAAARPKTHIQHGIRDMMRSRCISILRHAIWWHQASVGDTTCQPACNRFERAVLTGCC